MSRSIESLHMLNLSLQSPNWFIVLSLSTTTPISISIQPAYARPLSLESKIFTCRQLKHPRSDLHNEFAFPHWHGMAWHSYILVALFLSSKLAFGLHRKPRLSSHPDATSRTTLTLWPLKLFVARASMPPRRHTRLV